jgi:putative addiction module component (TIGR02574 family)
MTKEQLKEIHKLSKEEKIELVQTLWDDIASDQATAIPEEHKKLLEETLQKLADGNSQFSQWEEVREKYVS